MPESPYPMLPLNEALALIQREIHPLPPVILPFYKALDLALAEDVVAGESMPPFPSARVDGFAVVAADGSGSRRLIGMQVAGYIADIRVEPGTAVLVTTGAPVPSGADAVVMVEQTEEKDGLVHILTSDIWPGMNIRPVGEDFETGQLVLAKGAVLGPAELGLLGTVGKTEVAVHRRPVVAVISTGDEIVDPHEKPRPGQIRDSNRFTLMAAVRRAGAEPLDMGIVHDKHRNLQAALERALAEADVLLTSGGVSMGQLDLVKPYLAERGVIHFGRVKVKPGKPFTFATVNGKPCFAMPGFPVSALVSFEIFVRPALLKMAGQPPLDRPRAQVVLAHPVKHAADRTEFQRAKLTRQADGVLLASTNGLQESGRLLSMVGANGLILLPAGQGDFEAGAMVETLILGPIEIA